MRHWRASPAARWSLLFRGVFNGFAAFLDVSANAFHGVAAKRAGGCKRQDHDRYDQSAKPVHVESPFDPLNRHRLNDALGKHFRFTAQVPNHHFLSL